MKKPQQIRASAAIEAIAGISEWIDSGGTLMRSFFAEALPARLVARDAR